MIFRFLFLLLFPILLNASNFIENKNSSVRIDRYKNFLLIEIDLKNDFITYWKNPGMSGVAPQITIDNLKSDIDYKLLYPTPIYYNEDSHINYIYKNKLFLPIKLLKNIPFNSKINISYAVCNKSCHLEYADFVIDDIKYNDDNLHKFTLEEKETNNYKLYINSITNKEVEIILEKKDNFHNFKPYIISESNGLFYDADYKIENNKVTIKSLFNRDSKNLGTIYLIFEDDGLLLEKNIEPYDALNKGNNLYYIFLISFLGGIILNFMPCVFPILSIKIFSFLKLSISDRRERNFHIFSTMLGIMISFIIVGLISYSIRSFGEHIGINFYFQNPYFLISIIAMLVLLGSNLLGDFEIRLPRFLGNISINEESYLYSFFCGILTSILSVPCSAPLVTIAIGYALTSCFLESIFVFTFMGLGVSFPYIILLIFPNILRLLPKPGAWMVSLKKFLAILLFLSIIWLSYVLLNQTGERVAIAVFLTAVIMKFILSNNQFILKFQNVKLCLYIASLVLIYALPSYLQSDYNDIKITDDFWEEFSEEQLNKYISENKIVLVEITADWCATCKINKFVNYTNKDLIAKYKNIGIIGMRGDITKSTSEEVKTYMKKHNIHSIPSNIMFGKKERDGIRLDIIFTPKTIFSTANKLLS